MNAPGRIAVAGAGVIGMLYAVLLARVAPGQVTLLTRRSAACTALATGIAVRAADGALVTGTPEVLTYDQALAGAGGTFDLVLVAFATYDNDALAPLVASLLAPHGIGVSVQNGLDNRSALAAVLGDARAFQASTTFAVHQNSDGQVQINGPGSTSLPALPATFAWVGPLFEAAALHPVFVADPDVLAWTKMATGVLGTLCIILGAPAGKLRGLPGMAPIAEQVLRETVRVGQACGVPLDAQELLVRQQRAWQSLGDDTRASLYSTFVAGRKTELDDRMGSILRRAREHGVDTPVLACLYQLAQARIALAGSA